MLLKDTDPATGLQPSKPKQRVNVLLLTVELFRVSLNVAVTEVLVSKVRKALTQTSAKSFLIGGGVAANTHIRRELTKLVEIEFPETKIYLPHISITGDNAIMIAQATLMHLMSGEMPKGGDIRADGNLSIQK